MRARTTQSTEGYTPIIEIAEKLRTSPNNLQQMVSRGIFKGRKIKGIQVEDQYVDRLQAIYGKGTND